MVELSSGTALFAILFILLLSITVSVYFHEHSMAQPIPPQATITINSSLEMPTDVTKTRIENESTGIDRVTNLFYSDLGIPKTKVNADVDVAIIDSGIDLHHPDLNVYKHVNFMNPDLGGSKFSSDDDNCGHGTGLAGVIGAKYNGIGVIGIAPGARLWSIKVLDYDSTLGKCVGSIQSVIEAVKYVTSKASQIDVAILSFGCKCNSTALDDAIDRAVAAGVTIIVAAGNANSDASKWSPANHNDVIAVSSITDFDGKCGGLHKPLWVKAGQHSELYEDDSFAKFSNYGKDIDIAAPGVSIQTTGINGTYSKTSGTSIAAAEVAGAAALYKSVNPHLSRSDILQTLRNTGSKLTTQCDGNARGYFDYRHDSDNIHEPLLFVDIFPFLYKKIYLEQIKDSTLASGIRLASDPSGLAINPNTNMIYVANRGSDTISVIDESTNQIVANISLSSIPVSLALNPNTNRLFVANTVSNTVTVIDSITNKVIMEGIPVGKDPADIVVDPEDALIFVSNSGNNTVSVISDFTLRKIIDIPVANRPVGLSLNSLKNTLYVTNMGSNTVQIIGYVPSYSKFTYTPAVNVTVGRAPFMISVNPITNMAYVTNSGSNSVYVIDGLTTDLLANITVGKRPLGIDIDPITNMAYVTNSGSNSVSVINGSTNNVTNISVGERPVDIIANPSLDKIYVANAGSRTLHTLNGTANKLTVGIIYNVNPPNSGHIICNNRAVYTNYIKYNIGTHVRCEAIANVGFKFSSWSSNGITSSNTIDPLKFTTEKEGTAFTANFVQSASLDESLQKILLFLGLLTPVSTILAIMNNFSSSKRPKIIVGIGALIAVVVGTAFIFSR